MSVKFHTIQEAAETFRVSVKTVQRRLHDAGILPARIGRTIVLTDQDIHQMVEASRWRSSSTHLANGERTSRTLSVGRSKVSSTKNLPSQQIAASLAAAWRSSARN